MPVNANYRQIPFQSALRSKPVRENFIEIQDDVNNLQNQISSLSSSTSTSEIIASRDEYNTLDDRLHFTQKLLGNGVITYNRLLSSCDNGIGWYEDANATVPGINTTLFVEGTGSLKMGKDGTSSAKFEYLLEPNVYSYEDKNIKFDVYVADSATLATLASAYFDLSPDLSIGANYKRFTLTLVVGWNEITLDCNNPGSTAGTVNDTDSIQAMRILFNTNAAGDTITSGNLLIDNVRFNGTEFKVKAQSTPDMTVQLLAGRAIINGYAINHTADSNSATITAPSVNPRIDLVTANITGSHYIITGAEAASPVRPDTPYNHIPLAEIYHRTTETTIEDSDGGGTEGYITDLRQMQSNHPIFLSGSGVPLGTIIAVHTDVLSAYLPDAIGSNYVPCDGAAALPTTYFSGAHANVPDLTDDRFLQGSSAYDADGSGSNEHNHMIYDSSPDGSWAGDGSTPLAWTIDGASTGASDTDFLASNQATDLYSQNTDSRPKYFAVLYYIRIR